MTLRSLPRVLVLVATLAATATACNPGLSAWGCQSPPESEHQARSPFPLTVIPNPARAGETATLHVGLPEDADPSVLGGPPSLAWQCWTGSEWVDTHQISRNGGTRFVPPGETTTSLGSLTLFPGDFTIQIPEVPAGWYRIKDLVAQGGGLVPGYLSIEVIVDDS